MACPEWDDDRVKVFLRLKPVPTQHNPYAVVDPRTLQTEAPKDSVSHKNATNGVGTHIHRFTFTSILENAEQKAVFDKCVLHHLQNFIGGRNFLLMAYGTTSAGKTFTMQGSVEHPGIIPRALDVVFTSLNGRIEANHKYQPHRATELAELTTEEAKREAAHRTFVLNIDLSNYQRMPEASYATFRSDPTTCSAEDSQRFQNTTFREMKTRLSTEEWTEGTDHRFMIWVSMVEIYNEHIFDMLEVPATEKGHQRGNLSYGEDDNGRTYIKNLRHVSVTSADEAFQVLEFGRANLHLAPTMLNHHSSRSHCICTVTLARFIDYENGPHAIMSKFSLCDLAGSERAKKTLNKGDRLVESKAINASLLTLGTCLKVLKENQSSKVQKIIPYRESKLTRLFRFAVTGKEPFAMIANVTTDPQLFDETMNVLKFSAIAQQIVPQLVSMKPRRVMLPKRTRFSRLAASSKLIDWEQASVVEVEEPKESAGVDSAAYQQLLALTDELKEELAQEKEKCTRIEKDIRQELCEKYSELVKSIQERNMTKQDEERKERSELNEAHRKRMDKVVGYYQKKMKKLKLAREDDDDEEIEDLRKEVGYVRAENASLREQVRITTEANATLKQEVSGVTFQLAEANRLLAVERRKSHAFGEGHDAGIEELEAQLVDKSRTIKELKHLLDEAATENADHTNSIKTLNEFIDKLEGDVAAIAEQKTDLSKQVEQQQAVFQMNTEVMEELETEVAQLRENEKGRETLEGKLLAATTMVTELQSEIGRLQKSTKKDAIKMERLMEDLRKKEAELEEITQAKSGLEIELTVIQEKLNTAEHYSGLLKTMKDEAEVRALAVPKLVEQNEQLKGEIENKAREMDSVLANRQTLFNNYEKEIRKLKDENEKLRKDVQFSNTVAMQQVTPQKADKEQISKLKEELRAKTEELQTVKREELEASTENADRLKTLNEYIDKLKEEVAELREEEKGKADLEGNLQAATTRVTDLQSEIARLKESKKEDAVKMERLMEEVRAKESELEMNTQAKSGLESELTVIQEKLNTAEHYRGMLKTMKDEAEAGAELEAEVRTLAVPKLLEQIEQLKGEINNNAREMECVLANKKMYEKEIRKLTEENENLRKDSNAVVLGQITPQMTRNQSIRKEERQIEEVSKGGNVMVEKQQIIPATPDQLTTQDTLQNSESKGEASLSNNKKRSGKRRKRSGRKKKKADAEKEETKETAGIDENKTRGNPKQELLLEQSSSREDSPFVEIKKKPQVARTPDRLAKEMSKLSVQSSGYKPNETVHPSAIRSARTKGKKTDQKRAEPEKKTAQVCGKKLFVENDFDNIEDLDSSIIAEPVVTRLRSKRK